jgi:N-methylhydantoinase A/oxoprolinase/acetone carboxylase beta subunit
MRFERAVDVRYLGQSYEIPLPYRPEPPADLALRFHAAHEKTYAYRHERERWRS